MAWREEVGVITGDLLKQNPPEDLLEDYPLKPHELLRDRSDRVHKRLSKLAERHRHEPDRHEPVWLLADDGSVEVLTLEKLASGKKERIEECTILLPAAAGGLRGGLLDGDSDSAGDEDVADEWTATDRPQPRIRVRDGSPQPVDKIKEMRLIRTIDTDPRDEEESEEDEAAGRRYWHWYELPRKQPITAARREISERSSGRSIQMMSSETRLGSSSTCRCLRGTAKGCCLRGQISRPWKEETAVSDNHWQPAMRHAACKVWKKEPAIQPE